MNLNPQVESQTQPSRAADMPFWQHFRSEMPVSRKWAYLDHAAVGPLPLAATTAIATYLGQCSESGDVHWPEWAAAVERTRADAATLINATPDEIALVHSTTEGITLVAEGIDWRDGDNVVLPSGEFPSNVYPWLNLRHRGVEVRQVAMPEADFDYQRLADACDSRTRIVSASWIGFANGYRTDPATLAQIAHQAGAYLMLDAIQGLGVFPLDVRLADIDFLAADGHKWMLGPEGAGIAFIRRELLDHLRPNVVGWNSVVDRFDFQKIDMNLRPNAARYEAGSQNMIGQIGLGGSLQTLLEHGLSASSDLFAQRIVEQTLQLKQQLIDLGAEVYPIPAAHQTGILLFQVPGHDPAVVREKLLAAGVVSSCRGGRVRVAVHVYNDPSDFDRVLNVIDRLS